MSKNRNKYLIFVRLGDYVSIVLILHNTLNTDTHNFIHDQNLIHADPYKNHLLRKNLNVKCLLKNIVTTYVTNSGAVKLKCYKFINFNTEGDDHNIMFASKQRRRVIITALSRDVLHNHIINYCVYYMYIGF